MKKQNLIKLITKAKTSFLMMTMILGVFAISAFAVDRRVDMQGSTATIPKGNTVERSLRRIPAKTAGQLRLRLKWHAVNVVPTFNRLTVRLRRGSRTLSTRTCYSYHANKSPKCTINYAVSQTEANRNGVWNIQVTNNSGFEVMGFDVEKGSDINPFVPSFRSVFRYTPTPPACSAVTRNLNMQGSTATIPKGNTVDRTLYGVRKSRGVILLRAKWHAVNVIPTFNRLRVQLLKPNGSVASTKTGYSYHASGKSPRMIIRYNVTTADANLSGTWKLRVQNNSGFEVMGFDVEKGSDVNPFVPSFKSTYRNSCP